MQNIQMVNTFGARTVHVTFLASPNKSITHQPIVRELFKPSEDAVF